MDFAQPFGIGELEEFIGLRRGKTRIFGPPHRKPRVRAEAAG